MRQWTTALVRHRCFVLGAWTLIVVLCGVFGYRRFVLVREAWRFAGETPYPYYPLWLLFLDVALIATGFVLLSFRAVAGDTPRERFATTIYVGCVCTFAAANVLADVAFQLMCMRLY